MKKLLVLILFVLIIFVSCKKADMDSNNISDTSVSEHEKLAEIEDEKPEIELVADVEPIPQTTGVITDTRVRLRSEPNLESETLEFLNTGDELIILEESAEPQQVDTMHAHWYKVQPEGYPEGWVYGAFVDIVNYEIEWVELAIKHAVRTMLGKPDGIIMKSDLDGITELSLYRSDISRIDDLVHFTNLTVLDLSGNYSLNDISPLANLTNLTELNLLYNQLNDDSVFVLSGLTTLTELSLGGFNLYSSVIPYIFPLSTLTNLTSLNLKYINLSDLSTIYSFTKLTELDLSYNYNMNDISLLANLTNLTELNLNENGINDIRPLSGLTNLTKLWLMNNEISDISVLASLSNLTELDLTGNNIEDVSALAKLKQLTELSLYNNLIADWSPVAHMFGAEDIIFWKERSIENEVRSMIGKPVGSIMPSDLDSITELDLSHIDIFETDDIAHFKNLTSLTINFGTVDERSGRIGRNGDLKGLSGLSNLTELWLKGNITDLSPLSGLTNLTKLEIDNLVHKNGGTEVGYLEDISPLSSVTSLTNLILEMTSISDLSPLSELINLTNLSVRGSYDLNDVSPLSGLTNLTYLKVSGGNISDISALSGLTNLTSLSLPHNKVKDWLPVDHVENMIW